LPIHLIHIRLVEICANSRAQSSQCGDFVVRDVSVDGVDEGLSTVVREGGYDEEVYEGVAPGVVERDGRWGVGE
jgi:hypothetical protein